jgi:hypothetical protein
MMRRISSACAGLVGLALFLGSAAADESAAPEKFTLRYKFHPGETLRWNVVYRNRVTSAVSQTTKTAETTTTSVKAWRVKDVKADGTATFEHLVESLDMRHHLSGCDEMHYNSQTDKQPPQGFTDVAGAVGQTLSVVTIDPCGKIIKRERKPVKGSSQTDGELAIPLPSEPVPVGYTWSEPREVPVNGNNGGTLRVKTVQKFTLRSVKTGVATIDVVTQILTPIHDPAIESQLIASAAGGSVRLDIDAGRILGQQMDLDKHVVGFRGEASSVHYQTRFTEELLPAETRTASRTAAERHGPAIR